MPTVADLIAATETEIARQQARLEALRDAQKAAPSNGVVEPQGRYSGPAEAIVAYLTQHGPTNRKVLMEALKGRFESASANPQRSLTQAITAGIAKGTIISKRGKVAMA